MTLVTFSVISSKGTQVIHSSWPVLWFLDLCPSQFIVHMACFCGVLLCVPCSISFTWPVLWCLALSPFQFIIHMASFVVSCFVSRPVYYSRLFCGVLLCVPSSLLFTTPVFAVSCFVSLPAYRSHGLFVWYLALCPLTVYHSHGLFCGVLLCVPFSLSFT